MDVANTYNTFAETIYDKSPLNRVLEQGSAGESWQPTDNSGSSDGHTFKYEYKTNILAVASWEYRNDAISAYDFPANSLFVTLTKDENYREDVLSTMVWHFEYKDKAGRVILREEKVFTNLDKSEYELYQTHYMYDEYGLLRCIVPPKANGPGDTELCYYYDYDYRHRLIRKKIPGAEEITMVYDDRDRLIATQDGNIKNLLNEDFTFRPNSREFYFEHKYMGKLLTLLVVLNFKKEERKLRELKKK